MTRDEIYNIYKNKILSMNKVNPHDKTICQSLLKIAMIYRYMSNYNSII